MGRRKRDHKKQVCNEGNVEEGEGLGYRRGRMPEGRYDGLYPVREEETEALLANTTESDSDDDHRPAAWSGRRRGKRRTRSMSI